MKKKYIATKSKTDWNHLHAMREDAIDFSDTPKINPALFSKMVVRMPKPKELVSIRIDNDVLEWFRHHGKKYQTRINAVLRSYVEAHTH